MKWTGGKRVMKMGGDNSSIGVMLIGMVMEKRTVEETVGRF